MAPKATSSKILAVFGTRPEAIKMAPILVELGKRAEKMAIRYAVCVTAQHRRMLDQVLDIFDIPVDYDLDLMTEAQSPNQVAASVLAKMPAVLEAERPDWVIVQGDTTTVAAVALSAYYFQTKVAHVEAGLRTNDKWQPFPEEINRRVAGAIADLHFAPTQAAKVNLLREGIAEDSVVVTGNTSIDALQFMASKGPHANVDIVAESSVSHPGDGKMILVTAHRRENFGRPLESICEAIRTLATIYPGVRIVYPVHMNPSVREPVNRLLSGLPNVKLIDPVDYVRMVQLMSRSYLVLTDSGGIQEEAPALRKPVLVMRNVTERPEGIEAGVAKLVGTDAGRIVGAVRTLLEDRGEYEKMRKGVNPYGDGRASNRIVRVLLGESTDEFIPLGIG